jgi:phosphocarrier protein HPr
MTTISTTVMVINKLGLHARASAKLVQLASKFTAEILIVKGNKQANAKSIMSIMMLAAAKGSCLQIICIGEQAEPASIAIVELFTNAFGEGEN